MPCMACIRPFLLRRVVLIKKHRPNSMKHRQQSYPALLSIRSDLPLSSSLELFKQKPLQHRSLHRKITKELFMLLCFTTLSTLNLPTQELRKKNSFLFDSLLSIKYTTKVKEKAYFSFEFLHNKTRYFQHHNNERADNSEKRAEILYQADNSDTRAEILNRKR